MSSEIELDAIDGNDESVELISQAMARMRLMTGRRIISRMALANAPVDFELSHLDVIEAVKRIGKEGEVTVGAIAETMRIDPSRSSRLVSELVQRGMLKRAVSQDDARRAVVEPTAAARAYFAEVASLKKRLIRAIVADWKDDEIEVFARLYLRFVAEFENQAKLGGECLDAPPG